MIFQIGIIYAPIEVKCQNKGGDQEKAKVGGFRFFKKKLMILKTTRKERKSSQRRFELC